jgi:hypothetical protein
MARVQFTCPVHGYQETVPRLVQLVPDEYSGGCGWALLNCQDGCTVNLQIAESQMIDLRWQGAPSISEIVEVESNQFANNR